MAKKNHKYRKLKFKNSLIFASEKTTLKLQRRATGKSQSVIYKAIELASQNKFVKIGVPNRERIRFFKKELEKTVASLCIHNSILKKIEIICPSYFQSKTYEGTVNPYEKGEVVIDEFDDFFYKLDRETFNEIKFLFNFPFAVGTPVQKYTNHLNFYHKQLGLKRRQRFAINQLKEFQVGDIVTKEYVDWAIRGD